MTREALQTELKQQQERLTWTRQAYSIDQSHPMLSRADRIQLQIDEIHDDLCQFPDAVSYGSINDGIMKYIKSQIDQLRNDMLIRNK